MEAGYSFTPKMGPNLMQQQPREEEERAHIGSDTTLRPNGPLVSARKGLWIPSDQGQVGRRGRRREARDLQSSVWDQPGTGND